MLFPGGVPVVGIITRIRRFEIADKDSNRDAKVGEGRLLDIVYTGDLAV
jgi:hypothetical protein